MTLPPAASSDEGFCPAARIESPQLVRDRKNPAATTSTIATQKMPDCWKREGPTTGRSLSPGMGSDGAVPRLVFDFALFWR